MFDPYRAWLGIPTDRRPPTHYDLLGVTADEIDPDVIQNALVMRMGHLRKFQTGPNAEDCIRVMRELSTAAEVLSDAERRKEYQRSIRIATPIAPLAARPIDRQEAVRERLPKLRRPDARSASSAHRNPRFALIVGTASAVVLALMFLTAFLALPKITGRQDSNFREVKADAKESSPLEANSSDSNAQTTSDGSGQQEITNTVGMTFVLISAGTFQMGSSQRVADEAYHAVTSTSVFRDVPKEWFDREVPQHAVRISKAFYLSKYEVTQAEWEKLMGTRPWAGIPNVRIGGTYPACMICWDEAVSFCWWLTQRERASGHLSPTEEYRLPTEAEWEYACRAGTTSHYSFGDNEAVLLEYAWFRGNTWDSREAYAHEVGKKKPNPWGLYDMHGNVWEWCSDWCGKDYYRFSLVDDPRGPSSSGSRIFRGGSLHDPPSGGVRSACRGERPPHERHNGVGFRLARTTP